MAKFNIELLGDKALSQLFDGLPDKMQKQALDVAMKDAMSNIVLPDVQRRAPKGPTGKLVKFLKVKALKRSRRRSGYAVWTGTRQQMGIGFRRTRIRYTGSGDSLRIVRGKEVGYYPAHVELGYKIHSVEFGDHKQPPRPFLRPALIENQDRILAKVAENVRALLEGGALK